MSSKLEKFLIEFETFSNKRIKAVKEQQGEDVARVVAKEYERMKLQLLKTIRVILTD